MLVTPPFGASSNIALWRAYSKPPVELVVADLEWQDKADEEIMMKMVRMKQYLEQLRRRTYG